MHIQYVIIQYEQRKAFDNNLGGPTETVQRYNVKSNQNTFTRAYLISLREYI